MLSYFLTAVLILGILLVKRGIIFPPWSRLSTNWASIEAVVVSWWRKGEAERVGGRALSGESELRRLFKWALRKLKPLEEASFDGLLGKPISLTLADLVPGAIWCKIWILARL